MDNKIKTVKLKKWKVSDLNGRTKFKNSGIFGR